MFSRVKYAPGRLGISTEVRHGSTHPPLSPGKPGASSYRQRQSLPRRARPNAYSTWSWERNRAEATQEARQPAAGDDGNIFGASPDGEAFCMDHGDHRLDPDGGVESPAEPGGDALALVVGGPDLWDAVPVDHERGASDPDASAWVVFCVDGEDAARPDDQMVDVGALAANG